MDEEQVMSKVKKAAKKVLISNKDMIEKNEKLLELLAAFLAPMEYGWKEFNGKWMVHREINESVPVIDKWENNLRELCKEHLWCYETAKEIFSGMVIKFNNDEVARLTMSPPEAEAKRFKVN